VGLACRFITVGDGDGVGVGAAAAAALGLSCIRAMVQTDQNLMGDQGVEHSNGPNRARFRASPDSPQVTLWECVCIAPSPFAPFLHRNRPPCCPSAQLHPPGQCDRDPRNRSIAQACVCDAPGNQHLTSSCCQRVLLTPCLCRAGPVAGRQVRWRRGCALSRIAP
jgi:hypothetical protein